MFVRTLLTGRLFVLAALFCLAVPRPAAAQMLPPLPPLGSSGWGSGYYPSYPAGGYAYTPGYYPTPGSYYSSYFLPANSVLQSTSPLVRQEPTQDGRVHLLLHVPAGAKVWFDGEPTRQTGSNREFVSPPLRPGKQYSYEVHVRWTAGDRTVDRRRTVPVHANLWREIDLTQATP
jgi:uncharacterized protein (TIGR03000 family)